MFGAPKDEEAQWLGRLEEGSSEAIARLRDGVRAGLSRCLRGKMGDADLDDLAQEAVIRILDKLDSFRGECRFSTWAMAIAVRHALARRRQHRFREVPIDSFRDLPDVAREGGPADAAQRRELVVLLHQAIQQDLTELQRVVTLAKLQGMPQDALAEKLGTSRGAIYKLHHDAQWKLKQSLERSGYTQEDIECLFGAN